jgi:hypothetical protein
MNDDFFIYSELRENTLDNINAHINEGGFTLDEAISAEYEDLIGGENPDLNLNNVMVLIIFMLACLKHGEIFDDIRNNIREIIAKDLIKNSIDKISKADYELL